jgi:hypothetical protein
VVTAPHRVQDRAGVLSGQPLPGRPDARRPAGRAPVFDPFDLTKLGVRVDGRDAGQALPYQIGRHSHPKARPEIPTEPPQPTGIDYLAFVDTEHGRTQATRVNYAALTDHPSATDVDSGTGDAEPDTADGDTTTAAL